MMMRRRRMRILPRHGCHCCSRFRCCHLWESLPVSRQVGALRSDGNQSAATPSTPTLAAHDHGQAAQQIPSPIHLMVPNLQLLGLDLAPAVGCSHYEYRLLLHCLLVYALGRPQHSRLLQAAQSAQSAQGPLAHPAARADLAAACPAACPAACDHRVSSGRYTRWYFRAGLPPRCSSSHRHLCYRRH